jgi:hypothetical protein
MEYHLERLPDERRESIQAHLVVCDACRRTVLDAADFSAAGEPAPVAVDLDSEWAAVKRRFGETAAPGPVRQPARMNPWIAAAAGLLLGAAISGLWALRIERTLYAERARAREDTRLLEDQLSAATRSRTPVPSADFRLFDVFPADAGSRSGRSTRPVSIVVPPTAGFALILSGAGLPRSDLYILELRTVNGDQTWRDERARLDRNGNFVVGFPAGSVPPGDYQMAAFREGGSQSQPLARYAIAVRTSP